LEKELRMIPRIQKEAVIEKLSTSKLLFIQGPRKVGKSTLIKDVLDNLKASFVWHDCSEKAVIKRLNGNTNELYNESCGIVVLFDAQYLSDLDSIVHNVLDGKIKPTLIIACSFKPKIDPDLLRALKIEGLEINFFAPSFYESAKHFGLTKEESLLEERLIYGNYPEVLADINNAEESLKGIIDRAIFTNLRDRERINKGDKLLRMLQLLAFNVGSTITFNDISERCGLDNETVERYIKLLEDAFVLFRLPSFHNNHRYELKKSTTIYFSDNGLRNVLIRNFNPTHLRNDMNELWRNYVISERIKWIRMNQLDKKCFFWKTHTKQTIDFLEYGDGQIRAYKTDWEKRKKVKFPTRFTETYPEANTTVINKATYWKVLTQKN